MSYNTVFSLSYKVFVVDEKQVELESWKEQVELESWRGI